MASEKYRILVVGGGICGLATALALRGPNRDITILEQSRMNKEVGALISLQPNASKIASKLGLEPFLSDKRPTIDQSFQIYDTTGKLVKKIELDHKSASTSRVCYHRVDLHDSLKEAATVDDGRTLPAKIEVASRVIACNPEAGSVTLESGAVWTADVIIAADGIHSVLRPYVLTEEELQDASRYSPKPTGVSAYRLILPTSRILENVPGIKDHLDPAASNTHMIFGNDKRVVMGPARQGEIFGISALVPDGKMHSEDNSLVKSTRAWTTKGSLTELLESFAEFPSWLKEIFSLAVGSEEEASGSEASSNATSELAIWQLRDMDPLPRWSRGRLILAGDAAHAMLPTQGQGASQSFEDAEALAEFFNDMQLAHESKTSSGSHALTTDDIQAFADRYFECRFRRVSLIQAYSREHGVRAGTTQHGSETKVNLDPEEFLAYNTSYRGARDWEERQRKEKARKIGPNGSSNIVSVAS